MDNLILLDTERMYVPSSIKSISKSYHFIENVYLKVLYSCFIIPKIKKYLKKGNCKIITTDKETEVTLNKHNIPHSTLKQYLNEKDYIRYDGEIFEFIKKLSNKFPEIDTQYKGISLWKMEEGDSYFAFLKPKLMYINIIKTIIEKEHAKKLVILNSSSQLGTIQKKFKEYLNIEDKTDIISLFRSIVIHLLIKIFTKVSCNFSLSKIKVSLNKNKKVKDIIFFEGERSFYYAYDFLNKFKNKVTLLHNIEYSKKVQNFDYVNINNFITKKSKINLISFKKELKNKFKILNKSKDIKNNLKYESIPIFNIIKDQFTYLFNLSYISNAIYLECFYNLFRVNKIKLIITHGECAKKNKILVAFSKKYNVKTLFIMHGTVNENTGIYNHLMSDKIAVFDDYYKKVFIKINNNAEKIVVTGNPSWDKINEINISKKELYFKLNIPNKKIIVLATTHIPWDLKFGMAYSTLKAMNHFKNYHIVIKMHPEEEPEFYNKIAKKLNIKITLVNDIKMLHPLIKYSELVIITDSTVGLETILLDKPLIDLSLNIIPFFNDYVKKEAALSVRNEKELVPAIKSIINNINTQKNLKKNRKKYIYDHNYKQDGKASKRIVNLINKMIN
jgi:UDP-N-acetylglucosamine 2-epimerase